jgi:hypothetical protein
MTDKEKIEKLNETNIKLQSELRGYKQLLKEAMDQEIKFDFFQLSSEWMQLKKEIEELKFTIAAQKSANELQRDEIGKLKSNPPICTGFLSHCLPHVFPKCDWHESKATVIDTICPNRNGTYHIEYLDLNTIKLTKIE